MRGKQSAIHLVMASESKRSENEGPSAKERSGIEKREGKGGSGKLGLPFGLGIITTRGKRIVKGEVCLSIRVAEATGSLQ